MTSLEDIFKVKQVENAPSTIRGILQTKNYEDFIILNDMGDKIYEFKGAKLANKCLPGDHVEWNGKCELELRDEHPQLIGTLELTSKMRYGLTSRGIPIYLFTPYNKSYPHFIVGCSEKDVSTNRIALITFDNWTTMFPRGLLLRIVGMSGDYDAEKEALIWQSCPYVYPKYEYNPEYKGSEDRVVLSGYTFNIDPQGCKDVDDVFTFERVDDHWKVTITISDVASYVEDGSAIDIMASLIGQTLYDLNGKVIRPMIPSAYSEGVCSLVPGKKSYGISLQFCWNGEITDIRWFESVFETDRSFTYEDFNAEYPLADIASYLAKEKITDSHKWVEQMMIFYNKEAGAKLKEIGMGILRKHSAPNIEKLQRYSQILSADIVKLAYSSAEYCLTDEDSLHYGMDSIYSHTTSPIRRYADLVNQRVLKLFIANSQNRYIVPLAMYDMNKREKAIKHFARDMDFLNAIYTNQPTIGIILEKIKIDTFMKIKLYIPNWKRTITTMYKYISDNYVLSRDEKSMIDVSDYREVVIQYSCNINARNWKERVIISIQ